MTGDFWFVCDCPVHDVFLPLADLSELTFCLQVSDDDSYISDVSDSISMDTYSNEGSSERHNSGTRYSNKLSICLCACVRCVWTY